MYDVGGIMTLRHMKIFVAVFENSSITKAAKELHLAQPSVSFSIKELEDYYGQRFFERIGRRIYPTSAAGDFYGYAVHIVSLFETMEKELKNGDELGTIRIGASITIGTHILPTLVKTFQEIFPDIRMEAVVNQSAAIEQHVLHNHIDIGMIETQPVSDAVCAVPFLEDELVAIVPKEHPLAGERGVTLSEMARYPFLMREKGSAGREISVRPAWESSSTQAIVQGVAKGLGVAVLPDLLVRRDLEQGVVFRAWLLRPIHRKLNLIYHKSKYFSKSMTTFLELCETYGKTKESEEQGGNDR